jgi:hypothetical protein
VSQGVDVASALRALRLFNEKADKLKELKFTEWVASEPTRFTLEFKRGGGITGKRYGPDAESVDAFVLTFRFFVSDREPSSFRRMARMYDELGKASLVSAPIVNAFIDTRTNMDQWLDRVVPVAFIRPQNADDKIFTRREVFEVFMWGALAHSSPKEKAQYEEWRREHPANLPRFEYEFDSILKEYFKAISHAQNLNERAIVELQSRALE